MRDRGGPNLQYELRQQVIEARRQTFDHLIERLGDRPATRYEEGTIAVQAEEHFHYRPLWAPDRELYDRRYSELRLTDPYSFLDPRQYYYYPYVSARATLHAELSATLAYLEQRDLLAKMPEAWRTGLLEGVLPLRHYEAGAAMASEAACRFSYGASVAQCAAFAGFDRIGAAQMLSRIGLSLDGSTADSLRAAKQHWLTSSSWQPLRRYVEELLVIDDWAVGLVAVDLVDSLTYPVVWRSLDEAALTGGAGAYSLLGQHFTAWYEDQRKWLDALYAAWLADPEQGKANASVLLGIVDAWLPRAREAVSLFSGPLRLAAGDALLDAVIDAAYAEVTERLATLGLEPAHVGAGR
ncbi:MAG: phenol 2-monooxygenase [Actinomycetota bacterium]|nr:phenol 2-monooxygenase [Actinomycetota bacterium]